ncbi:C40 family peptidase [Halomonas binhaiensis]|uniref:C40 family peptidase n=1 Tax=Halomonas binhaiensis TaxID=2562282 RepID=A0A5C1NP11_9GAMM|nr:NlpC/P60 family protein [Halomonas binhaiensis]QEM83589.1 C40 family peptidase [Halomonas binhaiensis]
MMPAPFPFVRVLPWLLAMLVMAGCSSPQLSTQDGSQGLSMERALVLTEARSAIGTPYRYGGNDERGMDCSGLVQMAYSRAGISVPRTSQSQYDNLPPIDSARPGDLLFFSTGKGSGVSHVGIYMGDDTMVHAPGSGRRVTTTSLALDYWSEHFVGAAAPAP